MSDVRLTGGCQCGAVRYALLKYPERPAVCHCRMCQKALGNVLGVFAGVEPEFFELTRGALSAFSSSPEADRCFCSQCGTPLAWRPTDGTWISVMVGSLDDPVAIPPIRYYGEESRIPWAASAAAHLATPTGDPASFLAFEGGTRKSFQHPDHDTTGWVPHVGGIV